MKRFVLALIVCLWACRADADATLRRVVGTCSFVGTTCTITPGISITSGDALVFFTGGSSSNNTLASVTATGHTVTVLDNVSAASNAWIGNAYECNAASGTPTFTLTQTNTSNDSYGILYEVQGNDTGSCVDGHTGQAQASPGTGTDGITSGAVTPASNGVFLIGGTQSACCSPPTISAGTGWSNLQLTNSGGDTTLNTEELAQATAASKAATFTQSSNVKAVTLIIGIKASGGGGGCTAPPSGFTFFGVGNCKGDN